MTDDRLIERLLIYSHLNVPDRLTLPGGEVPFSRIVEAAATILQRDGWLPPSRRGATAYAGASLEAKGEEVILHKCFEMGVMKYSSVESLPFQSITAAVRDWLMIEHGDSIDGIPIAWNK